MKTQEIKRNFIWVLAVLTLIGLLGLASISLAVEDTWTTKANMPTGRMSLSTSTVNGKIYAIGGTPMGVRGGRQTNVSTVEEYDPATDTWTTKADMPTARLYLSTSAVNGKIYAIGGARIASSEPLRTVEEYNPATDTRTTKAAMPKGKFDFSTSAVDGKIYAIGGTFAALPWAPVSTVEEYDTGFVPPPPETTSVDVTGKLTTTWGKIK